MESLLQDSGKPKLGISACLLGQRVRYDGGHKREHYLTDLLASSSSGFRSVRKSKSAWACREKPFGSLERRPILK
jgi:hypothetical protein